MGIWLSAAYVVKATNGTPIHTTMIVATMKNEIGSASHEWPGFESAQLTSPYWVSKIHCQTTVAVSAGIAQARISDVDTSSRILLAERLQQQGDQHAEHHRDGDVDGAEDQGSPQDGPEVALAEDLPEVVETDPGRRLPEDLLEPELVHRQHDQAVERIAEHHDHHRDRRQEQPVRKRR